MIRLCMFPLVVKAQKNAVVMNNNLPRLQSLHMKMIEARQMGNEMEGGLMMTYSFYLLNDVCTWRRL